LARLVQFGSDVLGERRPVGVALTRQEFRLLGLLANGYSYEAAGKELGISVNTIRNYIRSIYEKLHVHSKSEAVGKALREHLID
jgi:DNA-binding CsgD family transcriptional regulator